MAEIFVGSKGIWHKGIQMLFMLILKVLQILQWDSERSSDWLVGVPSIFSLVDRPHQDSSLDKANVFLLSMYSQVLLLSSGHGLGLSFSGTAPWGWSLSHSKWVAHAVSLRRTRHQRQCRIYTGWDIPEHTWKTWDAKRHLPGQDLKPYKKLKTTLHVLARVTHSEVSVDEAVLLARIVCVICQAGHKSCSLIMGTRKLIFL